MLCVRNSRTVARDAIKQHGMHNKSQNSCYIRHEKQFPLRVMGGIWAVTYPLGK